MPAKPTMIRQATGAQTSKAPQKQAASTSHHISRSFEVLYPEDGNEGKYTPIHFIDIHH